MDVAFSCAKAQLWPSAPKVAWRAALGVGRIGKLIKREK
jgi:hypothetical protein